MIDIPKRSLYTSKTCNKCNHPRISHEEWFSQKGVYQCQVYDGTGWANGCKCNQSKESDMI